MNHILIKRIKDFPDAVFEVTVKSGQTTRHKVILEEDYYKQLTNENISPEELIKKSFKFLLEREPNSSILSKFNLRQINFFFPDFEMLIKNYL